MKRIDWSNRKIEFLSAGWNLRRCSRQCSDRRNQVWGRRTDWKIGVLRILQNDWRTDSEKSVLSRGLNFVPIAKSTDEFLVKQDVVKFLRRIQLKAFFHNNEDNSNAADKDIFETLHVLNSKMDSPRGPICLFRFFHQKMPSWHSEAQIQCHTKFSKLSFEDWLALKNLSKRHDIVIKSADKGGAVVVWRSDL